MAASEEWRADLSWWEGRELGNEHDPYNQTPKLAPESEDAREYMALAKEIGDDLLSNAHTESKDGWEGGYVKEGITIHSKKGGDIMSFRGYGIIDNCTTEILRLFIVQIDQRSFWDPTFLHGQYHVTIAPEVRIMTHAYDAPFPVSPRDFVTIGCERLEQDGSLVAGVQSIVREDLPDRKGFVRGVLSSSGFVVRPLPPENDIPRVGVFYLATVDVKGWLPTWVVNLVNAQQPLNINLLKRLIHNVTGLVSDLLLQLHELDDSDWVVGNFVSLIDSSARKYNFENKKTIITDPFRYYLMDRRVGPTDDELFQHMQERGKVSTLQRLVRRFKAYMTTGTSGRLAPLSQYHQDE